MLPAKLLKENGSEKTKPPLYTVELEAYSIYHELDHILCTLQTYYEGSCRNQVKFILKQQTGSKIRWGTEKLYKPIESRLLAIKLRLAGSLDDIKSSPGNFIQGFGFTAWMSRSKT